MSISIPAEFVTKVIDDARTFHAHKIKDVNCKGYDGILGMHWRLHVFTDMPVRVVAIDYAYGEEGCAWTVDVQYSRSGACALYGVTPEGEIDLWQN